MNASGRLPGPWLFGIPAVLTEHLSDRTLRHMITNGELSGVERYKIFVKSKFMQKDHGKPKIAN
jgi:hypothetical protein